MSETCHPDRPRFGAPLCPHLRILPPVVGQAHRWFTGRGFESELLCKECSAEREAGQGIELALVCEECYEEAVIDWATVVAVRGEPEIKVQPAPFDITSREVSLPTALGSVCDVAPLVSEPGSRWILLAEDGTLARLDAETGDWASLSFSSVPAEPDHKPWCGHELRRRLHVSQDGRFAAVVNDYGRHGEVIDLRAARVSLRLDGGNYRYETVPFSFAFASLGGKTVAVHRTAWNRLDISDPRTGELLTAREFTSYNRGQPRPANYLDYFHGALAVSPDGCSIVDDGWIWQPDGLIRVWSLERWLKENVWESESGASVKNACYRAYYWDHALTWIGPRRFAIEGLGHDDYEIVPGARVFDLSRLTQSNEGYAPHRTAPWEVATFPGPGGRFFSDGSALFAADSQGFSRWDPEAGARTGALLGFSPTCFHQPARQFAELIAGRKLRLVRVEEMPGAATAWEDPVGAPARSSPPG